MKHDEIRAKRKARLAGFAKSHFILSGIGLAVLLPLYALFCESRHWLAIFLPVACVLMLGYAFAGIRSGRKNKWGFFGSWKEGLWAFLDPALIAWGWAALVVLSLLLGTYGLTLILFFASMLLASPSSLLVLLCISTPSPLSGWFGFILAAFLAGGVPPLLFWLGSLLAAKKNVPSERSADETECDLNADPDA